MDERYFEQEITSFSTFKKASIDTSSLIVLDHLGILGPLLSTITIFVCPGVHLEIGKDTEIGRTIAPKVYHSSLETSKTVDEEVLLLAQKERVSVVSEDRKILQKAELLGLQTYPCGILISFLLYAGSISIHEAESGWQEMRSTYPYRKDLDSYCDGLFRFLRRSL